MNSRNPKPNFFGITPPVSTRQPEPLEIVANEKLIETLTDYDQYEAPEEAQKRYYIIDISQIVLGKLHLLFREFVKTTSIKNGLPIQLANEVGGKIFTFGSYRLGVHGKGIY